MTHPADLGGNTLEFTAVRPPRTAPESLLLLKEERTRRRGTTTLTTGIGLAVVSYLSALVGALLVEPVHDTRDTRATLYLLLLLALITVTSAGYVLIGLGIAERLHRPDREANRVLVAAIGDLQENLAQLTRHTATMPERLAAMEEAVAAVPSYPEGVIDGAMLRVGAHGNNDR